MALLAPRLAILDDTDYGLDIDALKVVADGINRLRDSGRAMLVITHYQRLLDYIVPDRVHVLADVRIVRSGNKELAIELEEKGYAEFYSEKPISCKDPDLTQVFTKPSKLTGVIYEFINREGAGFCKDSVKSLMESTRKL